MNDYENNIDNIDIDWYLGFIFAVRGVHAKSKLFDVGLILLVVSYLALIIISGSISK